MALKINGFKIAGSCEDSFGPAAVFKEPRPRKNSNLGLNAPRVKGVGSGLIGPVSNATTRSMTNQEQSASKILVQQSPPETLTPLQSHNNRSANSICSGRESYNQPQIRRAALFRPLDIDQVLTPAKLEGHPDEFSSAQRSTVGVGGEGGEVD